MLQASRILIRLLCGCLLVTSVGCATLQLPFGTDRFEKATARNPVTQIICIWQPSEGRDPNGMPCRGFAGQILFLAGRNSLPVQMEGDVRIYLFDDQGTAEEQSKPIHQYDFDSGAWSRHLTKGTLGPTYSVFVPYTRRGVSEARCALRVRLQAGNQQAVFSDMSNIALDGREKKKSGVEDQVPTAEDSKATTEAVSQTMRRTTTISMNGETAKPTTKGGRPRTESPAARAEEASGRVQLANYEVGAESTDPGAQRIEQLEQLVQQLLEQQKGQNKELIRRPDSNPAASPAPDESSDRNRHRLMKHESSEGATAAPAPLTSDVQARHPLNDFEAEDAPRPIRTAARQRGEPASNHPLAALDEELSREETFMRPARKSPTQPIVRTGEEPFPSPRTIRASEQSEHRERSWSDAFEPIDTEAMETTSVEADATRRQRLRAAR